MSRKKPPQKPRHFTTSSSMVAFKCACGFPWQNDLLKGKSDEALIIERDEAFAHHVREMEKAGY